MKILFFLFMFCFTCYNLFLTFVMPQMIDKTCIMLIKDQNQGGLLMTNSKLK